MKRVVMNLNVIAVLMDVVAEFYSKPQMGGSLKVNSSRRDYYSKYAIPIHKGNKERVGEVAGGVAEAVKIAGGGQAIKKFARENPKPGEKRKLRDEGGKFRQRFVKSASGLITRALDEDDDGKLIAKKKSKKHKRSKIDDVLGDDSY